LIASERGPVSVMSISFGSIAAFHLAAKHPDRVKRMVVFGGYRNLELSFRFALGGAVAGAAAQVRDPLNGPAVIANLVEDMLPAAEAETFRAAALAFSRRTWSKHGAIEDKHDGRHLKVGAEIAATLEGDAARLFRVAARLEGNPLDVVDEVFERARGRFAFLDPSPLMARITAPVACVHGRDDDVIPWSESVAMARDLANGRAYITGLYGHTGRANGAAAGALVRELRAMGGVVDAMASLAR
jgi:pimeloyl-ACP methyl ester carboxylesterase